MYSGGFTEIMLDVLEPRLMYQYPGDPFYNVNINEEGKMDVTLGKLVPDYHRAIDHYLQYCLDEKARDGFRRANQHIKVTIAYGFLWSKFRSEINGTATQYQLQYTLYSFKNLAPNLRWYEDLSKWIIGERDIILNLPESNKGRKSFVDAVNNAHHLLALLNCLNEVQKIISQGIVLLTNLLKQPIVKPIEVPNDLNPGFDTYIKEEYRVKLIPILTQYFADKKQKVIVPMLYALEKLLYLEGKVNESEQTDLHKALTVTLGNIGQYKGFNTSLNIYDPRDQKTRSSYTQKIETYRTLIEKAMKG